MLTVKKAMEQHISKEIPDFLVKSTQGVALTAALILTPFTINNFIQERYLLGFFTSIILVLCSISAYFGHHGRYSLRINLFGIAPTLMLAIIIALNKLGMAGSYWPALGILAFYFILPEKFAWTANLIFVFLTIPIAWNILEPAIAARFLAVLIGVSFFSFFSLREINKQHYLIKKKSITDPLTGLQNRLLLQESIENAIHLNHRTNINMVLVMLDIDHFKKINDELGHHVGDVILKSLGDFLANNFRITDKVFRIGGEEFMVLIQNSSLNNALKVVDKLREDIEKLPLIPNKPVTVSIGVSYLQDNMNWEQWMKCCDDNLYKAKGNGRNQVVG